MVNYVLNNRPKISFGNTALSNMTNDLVEYKNILLVYGQNSIKKNGVYDEVISKLTGKNIFELSGITPNPRLSRVEEGIELCRDNNIDLIIAVGGGSVIDCAKAISICVYNEEEAWDVITKKCSPKDKIDLATVLTMTATGSETNNIFVILNDKLNLKRSLQHCMASPKFAYLNPEYTLTIPKRHTINGIVDTISHLLEQRINNKGITIYNEILETYIKRMITLGELLVNDLNNYDLRYEHMTIAMNGYNGDFRAILGGDWACHGLDYGLASSFDNYHGEGLSIVTPVWINYLSDTKSDLTIVAMTMRNIFNLSGSDIEVVKEGSDKLKEYFSKIGAPTTLSQIGIEVTTQLPKMIEDAQFTKPLGGTYQLEPEDIKEIYMRILNDK